VEIVDRVPLTVYWNLDDVHCTTMSPSNLQAKPPEVTIINGAGVILAVQDGPTEGGFFSDSTCTVTITFTDIPAADVYTATVKGPHGETGKRTVQDSGQPWQTISVDM
jgi:hypothetical protein